MTQLPSWLPGPGRRSGQFEGEAYGSEVSFFVVNAPPGDGPRLHRHPYSETFVVQAGRGRFDVDGQPVEAGAGDVVVVVPGAAHKFTSLGPDHLQLVAVHAGPRMETTWLEEESAS